MIHAVTGTWDGNDDDTDTAPSMPFMLPEPNKNNIIFYRKIVIMQFVLEKRIHYLLNHS